MKNLLITALFGMIVFLYYKNIQTSQKNSKLNLQISRYTTVSIENKSRCQKDGQAFIDDKVKFDNSTSTVNFYFNTNQSSYEFLYSPELNSCLVSWENTMLVNGELTTTYQITDIYSNNTIDVCGNKYKDEKSYGFFNTKDEYQKKLIDLGFRNSSKCVLNEK